MAPALILVVVTPHLTLKKLLGLGTMTMRNWVTGNWVGSSLGEDRLFRALGLGTMKNFKKWVIGLARVVVYNAIFQFESDGIGYGARCRGLGTMKIKITESLGWLRPW